MINTVKVDKDGVVRKVTVKYRNPTNQGRAPSVFKYVERNMRKLALFVKAEERREFENIDFDVNRFRENVEEEDEDVQHVVAEDQSVFFWGSGEANSQTNRTSDRPNDLHNNRGVKF